jgi:hypothetical protein
MQVAGYRLQVTDLARSSLQAPRSAWAASGIKRTTAKKRMYDFMADSFAMTHYERHPQSMPILDVELWRSKSNVALPLAAMQALE